MKKLFALIVVLLLLAAVGQVFADPPTPLEGPDNSPNGGHERSWDPPTDQCNAAHGAFQWFSDPSYHFGPGQPPYFGDSELGSARGGATGENNSSYSQSCNQ